MKRVILHIIALCGLGIIATAIVLASLALLLSMPDILNWLASYVGELTAWLIFLFLIAMVIILCVYRAKN